MGLAAFNRMRRLKAKQSKPDLSKLTTKELIALAKDKQIPNYSKMNKQQLIEALK